MTKFAKCALFFALPLALLGCKADEFQITLGTDDIATALGGVGGQVAFEMEFSSIGDLEDSQRAEIASFEDILSNYMTIGYFGIEAQDSGYALQIEGALPITGDAATVAPYFLWVGPSESFAGYAAVELRNGASFAAMKEEIRKVNFMLAPDAFHPTRIRLTGRNSDLIAPGAVVDGTPMALFRGPLDGRLTLLFEGGVYDETGALFLLAQP